MIRNWLFKRYNGWKNFLVETNFSHLRSNNPAALAAWYAQEKHQENLTK